MTAALIGGIIGGFLGLVGGLAGTYFSVKKAESARERSFVVRWAVILWIAIIAYTLTVLFIPNSRNWAWIPFSMFCPFVVIFLNKKHAAIRSIDQEKAEEDA